MLNFGMPAGFADALAEKYALMRMTATAQADSLGAAAGLDRVKTKLLPDQTAAEIGKVKAETGLIGENARMVRPLGMAQIGLQRSQAGNYDASSSLTNAQTDKERRMQRILSTSGLPGLFSGRSPLAGYGLADEM